MVLDMTMVFSNKLLSMGTKLNPQITGSERVILGKLRDLMFITQLDSMVTSKNIKMETLKEEFGKEVKLFKLLPMISQFQASILSILTISDSGDQDHTTNSILSNSTLEITMVPLLKDKKQNISLVSFIQMIIQNKESN